MHSILIPMADSGHDPTEVSIPYYIFKAANFKITIATEHGKAPQLDKMMLEGATGAILGATAAAKKAAATLAAEEMPFRNPIAWTDESFDIKAYDAVFLPGGHEKGVRQIIESESLHRHLREYFPLTRKSPESSDNDGGTSNSKNNKTIAAICHGVQVLAFTPSPTSAVQKFPLNEDGTISQNKKTPTDSPSSAPSYKSIIQTCKTTALPSHLETGVYQATKVLLGDYYKTFGAGTPNVEEYVRFGLDNPDEQFQQGPAWYSLSLGNPFVVEDAEYRYFSGRFPPDAEALAGRVVEVVREVAGLE